MLVFLPGQEEIESLKQLLEEYLPTVEPKKMTPLTSHTQQSAIGNSDLTMMQETSQSFRILPLYAALDQEEQMLSFQPSIPGVRKFVLSTNIAETSVTISGIKYVVDPGKVKSKCLAAGPTGSEMLRVVPVSQSQANQRAGRAGRESEGMCFRLFPESSFRKLDVSSLPEIQRVGVSQVILQLLAMGIRDPIHFPYVSPPSSQAMKCALLQLVDIGALDKVI